MTDLAQDIAWFAGLFEGEGSIVIHKNDGNRRKKTRVATLSIVSVDKDVIEKIVRTIGAGTMKGPYDRGNVKWQIYWGWRLHNAKDICELLTKMMPYLCSRRAAKAQECFNYLQQNRSIAGPPKVCPSGHPFSKENTYFEPKGNYRYCVTCHKAVSNYNRELKMARKRIELLAVPRMQNIIDNFSVQMA